VDPADLPAFKRTIRRLHNADPTFVESESVLIEVAGHTVWDGEVHIFDLMGHPTTKRCYAWSYAAGGKRHIVVILHALGIDSPDRAVQTYLAHATREGA
jgi:hypothetical protein